MSDHDTAERLRQALDAVAGEVRPRKDAYERALHEWRRRERRRRRVAVLLAALLVAAADVVGLWALNRSAGQEPRHGRVVFDAPPPVPPLVPPPAPPPVPPSAPLPGSPSLPPSQP